MSLYLEREKNGFELLYWLHTQKKSHIVSTRLVVILLLFYGIVRSEKRIEIKEYTEQVNKLMIIFGEIVFNELSNVVFVVECATKLSNKNQIITGVQKKSQT